MLGPEVVTVTIGVAFATVWVAVPLAELLFESPPYVAVIGSLPAGKDDVVIVTVPVELTVPVPRVTPPLVTAIVPVTPAGTVLVMVTGEP